MIIIQGLNTGNSANTQSLIIAFITVFIDMYLLELSRKPVVTGHRALENSILNPRLSVQGCSSSTIGPSHPHQGSTLSMHSAPRTYRSSTRSRTRRTALRMPSTCGVCVRRTGRTSNWRWRRSGRDRARRSGARAVIRARLRERQATRGGHSTAAAKGLRRCDVGGSLFAGLGGFSPLLRSKHHPAACPSLEKQDGGSVHAPFTRHRVSAVRWSSERALEEAVIRTNPTYM
ncbi:hypothetical protein BJV78DRAFT_1186313 [Lactifluus subvellereus]|nr:hypothetical protein BJV78DRAFT_1186313 [Lactifluus subvellereus]